LGKIYNELAQREDPYRNPIIVIPGLLGSKLVERSSGNIAWGAFGLGHANPNTEAGARLIALPMDKGKKLSELKDGVVSAGALDRVVYNFLGFPMQLNAYFNILRTLGVGGYKDQTLGEAGAIDYGDRHFTCFQFDYDWRRDIVENAQGLDRFIKEKTRYIREETEKRYGIKLEKVKFDIVTHSMGGLIARYYLRYGGTDLPGNGSLPEVTWAGARTVDHLVMIAPPNAGSLDTLHYLINGFRPEQFFPHYSATILGTMPSVYELLPRSRHNALLDEQGQPVVDIFDPGLWQHNRWGLADPEQDAVLAVLLPDIKEPEKRREIAVDHQRKALLRAKQFTTALDVPAEPPATLKILLIAGDSEETGKTATIDESGKVSTIDSGSGDGIVLRSSALMDERVNNNRRARLDSPIQWNQVLFLHSDHLGITKDPAFTDNILFFLLESQMGR
jgi:pimeloyl-ACP methyl ester carboxylesterase